MILINLSSIFRLTTKSISKLKYENSVNFSEYIMKQFRIYESSLYNILDIPEEDQLWNGSIDDLKKMINQIMDYEIKREFSFKLEVLIHKSQKKLAETSKINNFIRGIMSDFPLEIMEMSYKIREELVIPPNNFDFLTRQGLTDQENIILILGNH